MTESKLTLETFPWDMGGKGKVNDDKTILQDGTRTAVLSTLTVMAEQSSDGKLIPLTELDPALTAASMLCGANGGNLAAWQAVGDGSFTIEVDGVSLDVTGLVFTAVAALTDIAGIINIGLLGRAVCFYDEVGDVFTFVSLKTGLPASSITVLTAGSAGTDISGTGFLNGLTTVGTVTAATGEETTAIPAGIFMSNDIAAATIVAGDVDDQVLLVGSDKMIDEDMIVLENSLTLASVVTSTGKTIRQHLELLGIYPRTATNDQMIQPIA
ncbi:MAG: DUF3383 domain-containing protein [FCB group bacterium]|nr:DUF3383 domain-containing protein [FCB group bacterium]